MLGPTEAARRRRPPTWHHLPCLPVGAAFRSVNASLSGWLAGLPHRIGARLFATNDTEAGWRGWKITELRCGLARSYRDPRFDFLHPPLALDPQPPDTPDWPAADTPNLARPADCWNDVHGWPWEGAG